MCHSLGRRAGSKFTRLQSRGPVCVILPRPVFTHFRLRPICVIFDLSLSLLGNFFFTDLGPQVNAFEKEFSDHAGIKHCVALCSGTGAMHLALRDIGVGPGDEVVASSLTFMGNVSPVTFLGGIPVFIDSDRETWNLDPVLLSEELKACQKKGRLPKAAIPTDLYGQCADYDRIVEICDAYNVPVIIDAAESLGAAYKARKAGVGCKAAIFSFNGNKIITTSGGGMLASDDEELIENARKLSQQAREDFPHYEHHEIGYNYRMSNILAAIGRGQLMVLDERVKKKREIFSYYQQALSDLPGIEFMPEAPYGKSNRWLTVILVTPEEFGTDRETVRIALEAENIESRPVWKPMHMQPVFNTAIPSIENKKPDTGKPRYKCRAVGGEVAEDLFNRGLCLPSGTAMTKSDQNRVIEIIRSCHRP